MSEWKEAPGWLLEILKKEQRRPPWETWDLSLRPAFARLGIEPTDLSPSWENERVATVMADGPNGPRLVAVKRRNGESEATSVLSALAELLIELRTPGGEKPKK